ncbi:hypothetical protein Dimus_023681 [Dionaea muscipula]
MPSASMDVINSILNIVAPPFTFIALCMLLPPLHAFRSLLTLLSNILLEDVAGKVVLVTGASSGIGEHVAYEYAKRGACLVLAARREKGLRQVADTCLDLGSPDVIVVPSDVANYDDCRIMVDAAVRHFGRLDHLVNNAGISTVSMLEDYDHVNKARPIMDVNFWGSVYTTWFAIPHLRNTRGKIIAMSSSAAWLPAPRMSIYNASKAALLQLYETLRVELGPEIKITIATPGFIESELTKGKFLSKEGPMTVDQEMRDVQVNVIPVGSAEGCAKSIVDGACRGDRYVTDPAWFRITYYWQVFCPDLVEWAYRLLYLGDSPRDVLGKKILDLTGLQSLLYPSAIQAPAAEIKTE